MTARNLVAEAREKLEGTTPGPWREYMHDICANDDDIVIAGMGVSQGARSAMYSAKKAHTAEGQANARLIAAAPELLAALADRVEELEAALSLLSKGLPHNPPHTGKAKSDIAKGGTYEF